MSYQNFKEIIKQEWEREFPENPLSYESSMFTMYEQMVERICVRVHNGAIELAAEEAYAYKQFGNPGVFVDKDSILKLKINETEI